MKSGCWFLFWTGIYALFGCSLYLPDISTFCSFQKVDSKHFLDECSCACTCKTKIEASPRLTTRQNDWWRNSAWSFGTSDGSFPPQQNHMACWALHQFFLPMYNISFASVGSNDSCHWPALTYFANSFVKPISPQTSIISCLEYLLSLTITLFIWER